MYYSAQRSTHAFKCSKQQHRKGITRRADMHMCHLPFYPFSLADAFGARAEPCLFALNK